MSGARLLTPQGVGAVAVVAVADVPAGVTLHAPSGALRAWPEPGGVVHARLMAHGRVLDDALVVGCASGFELHLHGGDGVVRGVLEQWGASAGESSTGTAACVSWRAARVAWSHIDGPGAALGRDARNALERGCASSELLSRVATARSLVSLGRCLARQPRVALVGRPNSGKSTLFNALIGFERVLVSPVAGTTRDPIEALWLLRDVPILLVDTAGVPDGAGQTAGPVPDRVPDRLPDQVPGEVPADLRLHLKAAPQGWAAGTVQEAGRLAVTSQTDRWEDAAESASRSVGNPDFGPGTPREVCAVSAQTGAGLGDLARRMAERLGIPPVGPQDLLAPLDREFAGLLEQVSELPGSKTRHEGPPGGLD